MFINPIGFQRDARNQKLQLFIKVVVASFSARNRLCPFFKAHYPVALNLVISYSWIIDFCLAADVVCCVLCKRVILQLQAAYLGIFIALYFAYFFVFFFYHSLVILFFFFYILPEAF